MFLLIKKNIESLHQIARSQVNYWAEILVLLEGLPLVKALCLYNQTIKQDSTIVISLTFNKKEAYGSLTSGHRKS